MRHVEVRDHRVRQFETKAGVDEQSCKAVVISSNRVGLERASNAGSYGNDSSASASSVIDRRDRRVRNAVPFGFHRMALDLAATNRHKGAGSDVQSELS